MKKFILDLIGIILIIVSFVMEGYNIFRLLIILIGITILTLAIVIKNPKNVFLLLILPILFILLCYVIDCLLFSKYNKLPIFIYEEKSNEKISIYNSFFYRIYNCNNELYLDYGFKKNYLCNPNDLEKIDINAFLSEPLESYNNYHHKFIYLKGKISKIIGNDTIELNSYNKVDNNLNGYVSFKKDYTIKVKINVDLTKYRIYDEIDIIGLVYKKDKNIIEIKDSLIIKNNLYDSYNIEIVENKNKELVKYVEKNNFYLYGIDNIYIHYDENNIYELSYLFTDLRLTLEDILKDIEKKDLKDEEEIIKGYLYELNKFNCLVCENKRVIFGNRKIELNIDLCEL